MTEILNNKETVESVNIFEDNRERTEKGAHKYDYSTDLDPNDIKAKWEDFNLKEDLLRGIYSVGFDTPSNIQKVAIRPLIERRDVRGHAQSGTGKTGAFGIATLQVIDEMHQSTQALIVVNTREVATQIAQRLAEFSSFMNVSICTLVGGTSVAESQKELDACPHIVVGTLGRTNHMLSLGCLNLHNLKIFIVDEADEMLKTEFQDELKTVFNTLYDNVQIGFFSATWEAEETEIANQLLDCPVEVNMCVSEHTLKGIEQYFVNVGQRRGSDLRRCNKFSTLLEIFTKQSVGQCIVFLNTRRRAEDVFNALQNEKIPCEMMHGELTMEQRKNVINKMITGELRCVISAGLVERGVDLQQLSVVINYDLPKNNISSYIHRIGRAGRYGRKGVAINLIFDDEKTIIENLEQHYRTAIPPMPSNVNLN